MKLLKLSIILLLSAFPTNLSAGPGDTIVVQTIDYTTPVNPGWNAPRSGYFLFPPEGTSFEKILMYHTLICDPSQSPACGEWDYTTHTYLHDHTGNYDSNLYYHPNYIIGGQSPDSFMYMNDVSWDYKTYFLYQNNTSPTNIISLGNLSQQTLLNNPSVTSDARHQYLFTLQELQSAGLNAGDITGIEIYFNSTGQILKNFTIKLKNTTLDELTPSLFENNGFTTVYKWNYSTSTTGLYVTIPFSFPFNWDGSSNIVIDISYQEDLGSDTYELAGQDAGFNAGISSMDEDHCLYFDGDFVEIPVDAISQLDSAVTISFWQFGGLNQPINNSIIMAQDAEGNRILNIHMPWGNGRVYWDAGYDAGYDRIDKAADPSNYKGQWNYWVFTKDVGAKEMRIYLNGIPWHIGSNKSKPLSGITSFIIGAGSNAANFYQGMIDEFTVWNDVLDLNTIMEWMHKEIDPSHPNYDALLAYYKFNEGSGYVTMDSSPNPLQGNLYGYPQWKTHEGDRVTGFVQNNIRPAIKIQSGAYNPATLDSTLIIDTIAQSETMIVMYENQNNPLEPTDTLNKWPHYYLYTFGPNGVPIDTTLVTPDGILYKEEYPYYVPYEVIVRYELGRFITPYGNGLSLGNGFTWVYDVTDFIQFLHDTVHISAGNFQELLDLKFYMIEGTPPRDVIKLDRLWNGTYSLTNFENVVLPDTIDLDPAADMFRVKIATSGHQWDNATNCAEFCQKTHWLDVNDNTEYTWEILDECATNPLYPQGGTWIYDRAGWCPGAKVTNRDFEVTPFISGNSAIIDYNAQSDPYGQYIVSSFFISYSDANFTLDAAIEDVIKPNKMKFYGRFNPMCGKPEIVIKNTGSETLTSLSISYGPQGGTMKNFNWTGQLDFLETETVILDPIDWTDWSAGNNIFLVEISNPNGGQDEYSFNNSYKTEFEITPEFPNEFIIHFKTNKVASQNRYEIIDAEGNVILEKDGFENETTYKDTVLLPDGCFTFTLYDSGDNGISFWANNQGSGFLYFKSLSGGVVYNFISDFGQFISADFTIGMAVNTEENNISGHFDVFPNPSQGNLNIAISLEHVQDVSINIYDLTGKILISKEYKNVMRFTDRLDLNFAKKGMYLVSIHTEEGIEVRKVVLAR